MKSVKKIVPFPQPARRRDHELAFLPAALEVMETPPSPTRRIMAATISTLFCGAVAWASLGTTDIVATAQGKIVPSGRTKVIQPLEIGVVREIHVRDGQTVKAGDVLIELDPTMTRAELGHLKSDLMNAQLDIARLHAAIANTDFEPPQGASSTLTEMQRQFLLSQTSEQNAKLAEIDRQRAQKEAERATIAATVAKLEASLPVLQERVEMRKTLFDHGSGSKSSYLELLQPFVEGQQDLLVQHSRYREADAAVAALVETRTKVQSEYRRTLFDELAKAEQKSGALVEDIKKAEERTKLQLLTAPVDGTVQQLSVHTVGGVVTPAQTLAVIVPTDSHLEIEAMVSNRDIGFVHAGQEAEVKVDTFNFTRYGLLHGKVLNVSQDAITRQKPEDKSGDKSLDAEPTSSEPKGQEMNYAARVSLDHTQMQIEERMVNLSPGMAVTVEIKTGSRRIISYLLSPVLRYKQETLRER